MFWMPDQVRHDELGTFYETIKVKNIMKSNVILKELRQLIRSGKWTTPTSGAAPGYVQANLVMLPEEDLTLM
jgi:uncharacterized protein YcsI (UPF0317 family)